MAQCASIGETAILTGLRCGAGSIQPGVTGCGDCALGGQNFIAAAAMAALGFAFGGAGGINCGIGYCLMSQGAGGFGIGIAAL